MSEQFPTDLKELMEELTDQDQERLTPPPSLWDGIAESIAADQQPVAQGASNVVTMRRRQPIILAAAAAVLILALVSTAAITSGGGSSSSVVATTTITDEGLPVTGAASSEARIVEGDDGQLQLELEVGELPEADGFYEVWLIDTNVEGMFSLGTINGDGTLDVPAGVDPADYPVVDISLEPIDGDPTHSGQSVLRGVLEL